MTYITEALWAEEPEVWEGIEGPDSASEGLTEEDFQDDEAALAGYDAEEEKLTLQSAPVFMDEDEYNAIHPGGITR